MSSHQPIQTPITGREPLGEIGKPLQALAQFYRALNGRDLALMRENWNHTDDVAMDNPLGGIKRGWPEIRSVYERIFTSPARVEVKFYDYTLHVIGDVFYAVGRQRGTPSVHPIQGGELRALRRLQREQPPGPYVFCSRRPDDGKGLIVRLGRRAGMAFPIPPTCCAMGAVTPWECWARYADYPGRGWGTRISSTQCVDGAGDVQWGPRSAVGGLNRHVNVVARAVGYVLAYRWEAAQQDW